MRGGAEWQRRFVEVSGRVLAFTIFWTNFSNLSDAGGGTFNITTGSLGGTIAGGTGSTLSYAGSAGPVSVNLQTGAATSVAGGISGINNLVGSGSAGDALTGTNASATWTINAANGGTLSTGSTFASFENLTGGSANDNFVLSGGTISGAINGGGGSDTLAGSTTYSITGANAGIATGVASFTSIETLTGTGGNDTFTLQSGVATFNGTINGGAGSDTLAATDGTNNWILTSLGSGTLNTTTSFTSIEAMVGGSGTDNLSGTAMGGTTTMTDPTSLLVGTLNAAGGVVNLTADSLGGTGVITSESGTFSSRSNVVGLGIDIANNLHMDGAATLWNFSAGSDAGSFSVANANISVQVGGVIRVASVGQQQAAQRGEQRFAEHRGGDRGGGEQDLRHRQRAEADRLRFRRRCRHHAADGSPHRRDRYFRCRSASPTAGKGKPCQ